MVEKTSFGELNVGSLYIVKHWDNRQQKYTDGPVLCNSIGDDTDKLGKSVNMVENGVGKLVELINKASEWTSENNVQYEVIFKVATGHPSGFFVTFAKNLVEPTAPASSANPPPPWS